jgi:hypothetical protein
MNKITHALSMFLMIWALGCGGDEFTSNNATSDSGVADVKTDKPHDVKPDTDAGDAKPDNLPEAGKEAEASIPEAGDEADAELPEADAEAPEADVEAPEADAEPAEADAEPPPDVIEEQPPLTDCQKFGILGKVTIIVRHNLAVSIEAGVKVLAVMSKLTFNDASKNTNFQTTCWALPGQKEFVCLPLDKFSLPTDVEPGMILEFEPGETAPSVQMTDGDGFCTAQDCTTGDFLVCSGKQKDPVCRVNNGNWIPAAEKATGPWNITTIKCPFPQSADQ